MWIRLEPSSGVPISRQIADQIRLQCASGALSTGDRLPSVRALARDLAVNQNTVLHVYERLTGDGLLERRHGDGTFVASAPSAAERRRHRQAIEREAETLARRAAALGIGREDLTETVAGAFDRVEAERRRAAGGSRKGEMQGGKP